MRATSLAPRAPKDLGRLTAAAAVIAAGATYSAGCAAPTCIIGAALAAVTLRIMLIDLKLRLIDRRDLIFLSTVGASETVLNSNSAIIDLAVKSCAGLMFSILLIAINFTYRTIRKIDGIGSGDIELVAAESFLLGIDDLAASLWLGAVLTAGFVLLRLARRPSRRVSRMRAPYGCFLAAAMLLIWLFRAMIADRALS